MKIEQQKVTRQNKRLETNILAMAVRRSLGAGSATAMLLISPMVLSDSPFGAVVELSGLDGSNGFVLNGVDAVDYAGISVSVAGDINGDGLDDLIIGAPYADPNGNSKAGASYVVFGGSGVGNTGAINLSDLSGTDGFVLNGVDTFDWSGRSVSGAGDINGDGVDDLIIGAPYARTNGRSSSGESYVVFGGSGVGSTGTINLSDLSGNDGFVLSGVDGAFGWSVSGAGDINGDGVADLIIGAPRADSNGNDRAGATYVVFGGSGVGSTGAVDLSDLDGSDGYVLNGVVADDRSGFSVSGVGDINSDGVDDLAIGAYSADPDDNDRAGATYVVFGGDGVGSTGVINLSDLSGTDGFVLNGLDVDDFSGRSVSGAGDLNGDGVDDLVIGAPYADPNGKNGAGQTYVVFGGSGVGSMGVFNLSELNGTDGFVLNGKDALDISGRSVSGAGDFNGDGVDDLIIGATYVKPNDIDNAGASYVVFGGSGVGSTGMINLSDLSRTGGFVFIGVDAYDRSGISVSGAGDINGDGLDDLIIGTFGADANGIDSAGESYVVFGNNIPAPPLGPGPDNDLFANATELDGVKQALTSGTTLTLNGTTLDATAQGGEPAHFQGGFGLPAGPRNSIWYRWTAQADQVVEIDTKGSDIATVIVAYTGTTLSGLKEVASAIDRVREVTRLRFVARAGETYHLAVDGYDNDSEGDIQLNIRQPTMDPSECTITGTNGPDVLTGTTGPDVICALDGNDVIKSLGGADIIFAGNGLDFIGSGSGNDKVFGEDGNDVLVGGSGNDLLVGGLLADRLYGGSGNDIVFGGSGADRLFGANGNDSLFGEMGGDRLFGGPGNDLLDGGPFNDVCVDSAGSDTLVGC